MIIAAQQQVPHFTRADEFSRGRDSCCEKRILIAAVQTTRSPQDQTDISNGNTRAVEKDAPERAPFDPNIPGYQHEKREQNGSERPARIAGYALDFHPTERHAYGREK